MTTYTRLEHRKIVLCESVGLGNDGDKIDTSTKTLHDFNVERLQPSEKVKCHQFYLRIASPNPNIPRQSEKKKLTYDLSGE